MELAPLPPEIVGLLNRLARGLDAGPCLEQAQEWVRTAVDSLEAESDRYLSEADESACANALFLLRQVEADLASPSDDPEALAGSLSRAAYEIVPLLRRIVRDRSHTWFVEIEALDALLVAAVCHLQGRGEMESVVQRLPEAVRSVQDLYGRFVGQALPPEVREALEKGYGVVLEGLEGVRGSLAGGGRRTLERAVARLKAGGELLSYQARWSSSAPGSVLRELTESPLAERIARLQGLLLPPRLREALLSEVEDALAALDGEGLDPELRDEECARLERALAAVARNQLRPGRLPNARLRELAETIAGAWQGTVPDQVLAERLPGLLRDTDPEEVRGAALHVEEYLETAERDHLLAALELLLENSAT